MAQLPKQSPPPAHLDDVADYIIVKLNEAGSSLNVLKLHKLLYYVQAWYLAFKKNRCFNSAFQAWVHGPVSRSLYDRFPGKSMYSPVRSRDIRDDFAIENIPRAVKRHIDNVLEVYADLTDDQLEEMTHREQPWIEARGDCDPKERCETAILDATMASYYRARVQRHGSKKAS